MNYAVSDTVRTVSLIVHWRQYGKTFYVQKITRCPTNLKGNLLKKLLVDFEFVQATLFFSCFFICQRGKQPFPVLYTLLFQFVHDGNFKFTSF